MASNRSFTFKRVQTGNAFLPMPIKWDAFRQVAPTDGPKKVAWYMLADFHGYDPYLVKVTSLDNPTKDDVEFQFINCDDGELVGSVHKINLSNHLLVSSPSPSTLPDAALLAAGRNVAFLMLNPEALDAHGLLADAQRANVDIMGKWPGGAEEALIKQLRSALRLVMPLVPLGAIPADEVLGLEALL